MLCLYEHNILALSEHACLLCALFVLGEESGMFPCKEQLFYFVMGDGLDSLWKRHDVLARIICCVCKNIMLCV